MNGLSVVVCTYNPEPGIFERVLRALGRCALPNLLPVEWIIIDNNSTPPIKNELYVRGAVSIIPNARIVSENRQGLTSSRKRGIRESVYNHILFLDDDNELLSDYLTQLADLICRYPFIGAINAGVINVEYIGSVHPWFSKKGKVHFQDSHLPQTVWGNDSHTFRHWPFGTGLMVKKEVAMRYLEQTETGRFSLTDRKGNLLTSGGDGQLVACALELGFAVGRAKELALNHLIASRKASISYLTRQDYGIYFSNEIFMKECYPDRFRVFSKWREAYILTRLFSLDLFKSVLKGDLKKYAISVAVTIGTLNGKRAASGKSFSLVPGMLEEIIAGK